MLRVRDGSGQERTFETSAELAGAIAAGEVRAGSEVFHTRGNVWLPVESHPAYPSAASATRVPQQPDNGPTNAAEPKAAEGPADSAPYRSRAGLLRTMLSLAMGAVLLGTGAVMSPRMAGLRGEPPKPVASSASAPEASDADTWDAAPRPSLPLPMNRPPAGDSLAPPAGAVVSRLGASRSSILPSYSESYEGARHDFLDGLKYVGFHHIFGTARLATEDSLRATRRRLRAADNLLRTYRGQEVLLEESYRAGSPDSTGSLREPFEPAEAARRLLADADTLVGLLQAAEGRFTVTGEGIRFQDARTGRRYAALRGALLASLPASGDTLPTPARFTLPSLTAALGNPPPPAPIH